MLSTLEVAAFFLATVYLPLADVITYYLACPIFVTALSALVLREHVGWRRWSAILIGFCGVLIALRPSAQTVSWPALIALGGSLSFALLMLITRSLRATPDIVLASSQFVGTFAARRGAVAVRLGDAEPGQPRPVCRGRLHFGGRAVVRQPLAEARAGERGGAVSVFDDRLGGDVRLSSCSATCRRWRRSSAPRSSSAPGSTSSCASSDLGAARRWSARRCEIRRRSGHRPHERDYSVPDIELLTRAPPRRTAPVLQRRPDAARQAEAIDRRRRAQRLEAMQLDAAPLEAAFLQDVARRRIGDARAGDQMLDDRIPRR